MGKTYKKQATKKIKPVKKDKYKLKIKDYEE